MRPWVRHLARAFLVVPLVAGSAFVAVGGERAYLGSSKCKVCHLREWKSWSETKMAKAFEVLKPGERAEQKKAAALDPRKDYTTDATCLPCHVTGYGKPGGFTGIEATPGLAGVGCEMCHGAGGGYVQNDYMSLKNKEYKKADLVAVGMVGEITEAQCRGCHNAKSPFVGEGYVFDFAARKEEGTHEKFALKYPH